MNTALFLDLVQEDSLSQKTRTRLTEKRVIEKLDLELDFSHVSFSSKTRQTHPHILFTPMHYEPNYAYPLLVWLHDAGGDERQLMRIMPMISMRNYVAVAPRGFVTDLPSHSATFDLSVSAILHRPKVHYDWTLSENSDSAIEQRIFDCMTIAQDRCHISSRRIFLAGFGTGGAAALRLAMLYPEHFAGAATFGGGIKADSLILPRSFVPGQPLSVFWGIDKIDSEHVCSLMGLFHTAGIASDIYEYPDTQQLTSTMLQDLNRWIMQIVCRPTMGS